MHTLCKFDPSLILLNTKHIRIELEDLDGVWSARSAGDSVSHVAPAVAEPVLDVADGLCARCNSRGSPLHSFPSPTFTCFHRIYKRCHRLQACPANAAAPLVGRPINLCKNGEAHFQLNLWIQRALSRAQPHSGRARLNSAVVQLSVWIRRDESFVAQAQRAPAGRRF